MVEACKIATNQISKMMEHERAATGSLCWRLTRNALNFNRPELHDAGPRAFGSNITVVSADKMVQHMTTNQYKPELQDSGT